MKEDKILFVLPVATQPRFSKRIKKYIDEGYDVTVASYERNYFNKNSLPEKIKFFRLGNMENGNYLKRIPIILRSLNTLRSLASKNDIVYIFSVDVLIFLSLFLKKEKVCFEIGDIRRFSTIKTLQYLFEKLYSVVLKRVNTIYVTSEAFKLYLSQKYNLNEARIKVILNKLREDAFPYNNKFDFNQITLNNYTIGIIGLLRYKNILDFLEGINKSSFLMFTVKIYGDGPLKDKILDYVDQKKVHYYGQFKYPDDLENIYKNVDLSFTMYNADDLNVRLALPNKLYESIYFRKPILVSKGTYLEKKVNEYKIGFSWNQSNVKELVHFLNSTDFIVAYNAMQNNFEKINKSEYLEPTHETNHPRPQIR